MYDALAISCQPSAFSYQLSNLVTTLCVVTQIPDVGTWPVMLWEVPLRGRGASQ
jgi:hypothetical protein